MTASNLAYWVVLLRNPHYDFTMSERQKFAELFVNVLSLLETLVEKCPACDGVGAQAGAHTDRINECAECGRSGRKKVAGAA